MRELGFNPDMNATRRDTDFAWYVVFKKRHDYSEQGRSAPTAPEAICRAALAAVEAQA